MKRWCELKEYQDVLNLWRENDMFERVKRFLNGDSKKVIIDIRYECAYCKSIINQNKIFSFLILPDENVKFCGLKRVIASGYSADSKYPLEMWYCAFQRVSNGSIEEEFIDTDYAIESTVPHECDDGSFGFARVQTVKQVRQDIT